MPTQQERRDSAVARLLDASIETIIELGYARASAATISKRAGLSAGALFRHFSTMSDFMAATAAEALGRQVLDFERRIAEARGSGLEVAGIFTIMREVMGSRTNAVLYELTNAARTDKDLQRILQAGTGEYLTTVRDAARALPEVAGISDKHFSMFVLLVTDIFDAEAVIHTVRPLSAAQQQDRDDFLQVIFDLTRQMR